MHPTWLISALFDCSTRFGVALLAKALFQIRQAGDANRWAFSYRPAMIIERFQDSQAEAVSKLIQSNLLEINGKDYPPDFIAYLVDCFSPTRILENARTQHIFVATEKGKVIGTGSLADFGSKEEPSYYGVAIFVEPEFQRKGIGRQIMRKVEAEAEEMGAHKITVRAAIGARVFYEKLGYTYQDGAEMQDEKGNYVMEKAFRKQPQ